jgi:Uncharacterised nucleotidyltransferase
VKLKTLFSALTLMNNSSAVLPPIRQIAAALRVTTEFLAHELAVPTHETPRWSLFEWDVARAVAAMQGISSLLHSRLCWEGPEGWRRFLHEQREQSIRRHGRILHLLQAIDSAARREGVVLVALKGAALQEFGFYAAGERPMGDIDLLARKSDIEPVAHLLDTCGYRHSFTSLRHQVFEPRCKNVPARIRLGEHIDNPIKIEVHMAVAEQLPMVSVDITRSIFPCQVHAGVNGYASTSSLMMHLLLHAAGNIRARALRFIQLHDIALLAGRLIAGDWQELIDAGSSDNGLWWAYAPLVLVNRYFPNAIPPSLFAGLREGCPCLLVRGLRSQLLVDVSWSNIRIQAFPGLEWSRTLSEALDFISSRIWPSRNAILELKEGLAQIPEGSSVPWYGVSHGSRILRWIVSKPPRVQTLLSVRSALTEER